MNLTPTPSQTIGPFFPGALARTASAPRPDAIGVVTVRGTIFDGADVPVTDALVEIWTADAEGRCSGDAGHFARCLTDADGAFELRIAKPGRVDAHQAPHLDVSVFARGLLQRAVTRMYFPDEEAANRADPVLGSVAADRRDTLIAVPHGELLRFDIHLQGSEETVFFAW